MKSNIEKNRVNSAARIALSRWEAENSISIQKFTVEHDHHSFYDITVYWDEFGSMTPSQMNKVVRSWTFRYSDDTPDYDFSLAYIISNGQKYYIFTPVGMVKLDDWNGKVIVQDDNSNHSSSSSSSNSSSSSSSSKTATCNYCNGTGKVNGDKCPWCNGSGKTYDNVFNDLLGD